MLAVQVLSGSKAGKERLVILCDDSTGLLGTFALVYNFFIGPTKIIFLQHFLKSRPIGDRCLYFNQIMFHSPVNDQINFVPVIGSKII